MVPEARNSVAQSIRAVATHGMWPWTSQVIVSHAVSMEPTSASAAATSSFLFVTWSSCSF